MSAETCWFKEVEYRVLEGKRGVKETYDGMAGSYDHSEHLYWTRKIEEGEERIIKRWVGNLLTPILDVGCGTGRYAIEVAGKGLEVVASDVSLKMLKKTVEKAKKHGVLEKVSPILADGEHLPFRDRSFNALICTLTFDHFEDCGLAAGEFSRVLEKDGLCVLSIFNSYTLDDFKRRNNLPPDKVPFRTEELSPVLTYEVGHSASEVEELFERYGIGVMEVRGCCYWHLLPMSLTKYYKTRLDSFFNFFKSLLKYAEIHVILMKKRT